MTRHSFIAYRNDCPAPGQPISFAGEACERFVPLRLPWTLCVRDRLPAGAAAVLVNPAHPFPDLALPIDAPQERILAAIDGKRSVGEILSGSVRGMSQERARGFISRLWDYDQIVFDVAGS